MTDRLHLFQSLKQQQDLRFPETVGRINPPLSSKYLQCCVPVGEINKIQHRKLKLSGMMPARECWFPVLWIDACTNCGSMEISREMLVPNESPHQPWEYTWERNRITYKAGEMLDMQDIQQSAHERKSIRATRLAPTQATCPTSASWNERRASLPDNNKRYLGLFQHILAVKWSLGKGARNRTSSFHERLPKPRLLSRAAAQASNRHHSDWLNWRFAAYARLQIGTY